MDGADQSNPDLFYPDYRIVLRAVQTPDPGLIGIIRQVPGSIQIMTIYE